MVYLAAGAQMLKISNNKSVYIGGLGSNYKRNIAFFERTGPFDEYRNDCRLEVRPHTDKNGKPTILGIGRIGHSACYYHNQNSIFIFSG